MSDVKPETDLLVVVERVDVLENLEELSKRALHCIKPSECLKLLREIDENKKLPYSMFDKYPYIYDILSYFVLSRFRDVMLKESNIYGHFKENLSKYIKNSTIVKVKADPKHKPDFFVSVNGNVSPVEIKLNRFDENAKKQLQRYMNFYKSEYGFAMARELTTILPDNITFIQFNDSEIWGD